MRDLDPINDIDLLNTGERVPRRRKAPTAPRTLVRVSEHDEQAALFAWAALQARKWPELELLFAIPNGSHRHISVARKLKAEGVKPGIPDLFLPVPRPVDFHLGLWLEMKVKPNKPTADQLWWHDRLRRVGYRVVVCYSADEARLVITTYLGR